jgi:tetratricopeptide (TPR) repeat protein
MGRAVCLAVMLNLVALMLGCSRERGADATAGTTEEPFAAAEAGRTAYEAAEQLAATHGRDDPGARTAYQRAVRCFDAALQSASLNADLYARRGRTRLRLGEFEKALADVHEALARDPQSSHAFATRGRLHFECGRLAEAMADFDRALLYDSGNVFALNNRGIAWRKQGRLAEAEADFREALVLEPKYYKASSNLGNLFAARGDPSLAIEAYTQAIDSNPRFAPAWIRRARLYLIAEEFDRGVADLNHALAITPENADLYVWRAMARIDRDLNLGEAELTNISEAQRSTIDAALADLAVALDLEPSNTMARRGRDLLLFLSEKHGLEAIVPTPQDAEGYYDRAILRIVRDLGASGVVQVDAAHRSSAEAALLDLATCLELDPAHKEARRIRILLLRGCGQYEQALDDLEHAMRQEPEDGMLYGIRALILRAQGDHEAADADVSKFQELEPRTALQPR